MQTSFALVEPDSRGRVTLARWLREGRQYIVSADESTGAITLEPVGLVLSEEAASDLAEHPERVAEMLSRARSAANASEPMSVDDLFDGI
jgi:hypothetical protein